MNDYQHAEPQSKYGDFQEAQSEIKVDFRYR